MKRQKYKLMKVFSISDMPEDAREEVFNVFEEVGNDLCFSYHLEDKDDECPALDKFLIEQGTIKDEEILILKTW
jgi:hypothetical protein